MSLKVAAGDFESLGACLVRCCSWQWSNWFGFAGVILEDGVMSSPWPKNQEETLTQLGSWLCLKMGGYQGYHKWWQFQQCGFGVPDFETPCMAVVRRNVFPFERVSWPQETRSFPRVDQPCLLWNVCSLPNHWGSIVNKHPKLALKSTKMESKFDIYQVHTLMLDIYLCYKWHAQCVNAICLDVLFPQESR